MRPRRRHERGCPRTVSGTGDAVAHDTVHRNAELPPILFAGKNGSLMSEMFGPSIVPPPRAQDSWHPVGWVGSQTRGMLSRRVTVFAYVLHPSYLLWASLPIKQSRSDWPGLGQFHNQNWHDRI
jgi:hypothetical protein